MVTTTRNELINFFKGRKKPKNITLNLFGEYFCMDSNFEIKIFSGSSSIAFSDGVCRSLGVEEGKIEIKKFANGETYVRLLENVREKDVFLIQTAVEPINDNLFELLIMIDAARRASAGRITVIMPNFFYARQDRKAASREAITAKLVANLLESSGANRIITLELHSDQAQGFFDIPFDNLTPKRIFIKKVKELGLDMDNCVVVAPDAGAAKKSTKISKTLDCGLAIINKVRTKHNEAEGWNIIGDDVKGKNCFVFDDMCDTGGSLVLAAKMLKENGAEKIYAFITHGIFSGNAIEKICSSEMEKLYTTNTLPQKGCANIEVIDVSDYFAETIKAIHENKSVSELFDKGL